MRDGKHIFEEIISVSQGICEIIIRIALGKQNYFGLLIDIIWKTS